MDMIKFNELVSGVIIFIIVLLLASWIGGTIGNYRGIETDDGFYNSIF